jgi:hypothetical protein
LPSAQHATAIASVERANGALVCMIEIVGDHLDHLFAAGALSAAASACAHRDPQLSPGQLLAQLDREIAPGRRARAIAVAVEGENVRIANAGARFPLVQRGGVLAPLAVRGDRLGEISAVRGDEVALTLAAGETLYLVGEPPVGAHAAQAGHLAHDQTDAIAKVAADADLAARARALVEGTDPAAGVVLALAR